MQKTMIQIRNNIIPFKGFAAFNFFGLIFVRKDENVTKKILNHESIHTEQMKETLFVLFYVIYLIEFLIRLLIRFDFTEAYFAVSFEHEAYFFQGDLEYLKRRSRYQWTKYLFTKNERKR